MKYPGYGKGEGWISTEAPTPPNVDTSALNTIIMGMLGLGTMRTVEGIKNVKSNSIAPPSPKKGSGFKWPWSKK